MIETKFRDIVNRAKAGQFPNLHIVFDGSGLANLSPAQKSEWVTIYPTDADHMDHFEVDVSILQRYVTPYIADTSLASTTVIGAMGLGVTHATTRDEADACLNILNKMFGVMMWELLGSRDKWELSFERYINRRFGEGYGQKGEVLCAQTRPMFKRWVPAMDWYSL